MARRIVGLDLGGYSVKLVRLEIAKQKSGFKVIDLAEELLSNEDKPLAEKQRDAILKLRDRGLFDSEVSSSGLSSSHGHFLSMLVPFLDTRKIAAVLPGLLEAELPFTTSDMVYTWQKSHEKPTGKDSEQKIFIAFGNKEEIASTLKILQPHLDPRQLHLSSVALFELVREFGIDTFFQPIALGNVEVNHKPLSAIINIGHETTDVCVFDALGIKHAKTILRGGKKLTQQIAQDLGIDISEAEKLKHEVMSLGNNEDSKDNIALKLKDLGQQFYSSLMDDVLRTIITINASGLGRVGSAMVIGGASLAQDLRSLYEPMLKAQDIVMISSGDLLPHNIDKNFSLGLSYALSCLKLNIKDNRFNFRKNEFVWRGELDFIRRKSVPLTLWALTILCMLVVMWFSNALVLDKQNESLSKEISSLCMSLTGKRDLTGNKCLSIMNDQISSALESSLPSYTASDIYINLARYIPKDLPVTISELDVLENKLRLTAEVKNFEDVDKLVENLSRIPCVSDLEKGSARQINGMVKFSVSSNLNCEEPPSSAKRGS